MYPSLSVEAAAPVAVVGKVVDKRGTRKVAQAYLNYLFTPEGQEIIARHHFRPRDPGVLKKYASRFPTVATFTVEEKLGGWDAVQKMHFADGAMYDQIMAKR
jgi:sulfate transport system substrate-binding protein